jgi:hypothetical protein
MPFSVFAGDQSADGVWTWSIAGQNGETICDLKQDGEKISGSYTNEFGRAELKDGTIKDGQIRFQVHREKNGQPFIITYSGKLTADQITGKCEFALNGQPVALDWKAKRDGTKTSRSPQSPSK